jgi:hypothetical protein
VPWERDTRARRYVVVLQSLTFIEGVPECRDFVEVCSG